MKCYNLWSRPLSIFIDKRGKNLIELSAANELCPLSCLSMRPNVTPLGLIYSLLHVCVLYSTSAKLAVFSNTIQLSRNFEWNKSSDDSLSKIKRFTAQRMKETELHHQSSSYVNTHLFFCQNHNAPVKWLGYATKMLLCKQLFSAGTTHLLTHLQVAENNAQNRYKVTKKQRLQQCDSRLCDAYVTHDRRMMTVMGKGVSKCIFVTDPWNKLFVT